MTLTLLQSGAVITCDHPDCSRSVVTGDDDVPVRWVAKAEKWFERERPWHVDGWWLCPEHKKWRPTNV